MHIEADDLTRPEVHALLREHLANMHELSPPESVHALDLDKLRAPGISFWTVWDGGTLLGCGALKQLDAAHGEIKSMRTPSRLRRRGAGRAMLTHIVAVAQARGYRRLSLETGSMAAFEPALTLYRSFDFVECGPFGDYRLDPLSTFMTRELPAAASGTVDGVEALRALYPMPGERAVKKEIARLDKYCRRFIELSPFLVLASSDAEHRLDASPRGGAPGFVKVSDAGELLIPDAPGNNRLDSLQNIVAVGRVGLLFMIPGFDETLRVNGDARLSVAPEDLAACTDERRAPKCVIRVQVRAAYLHCAKAFMRAGLWDPATRVDRSAMPTMGCMIGEQAGIEVPAETQDDMLRRYRKDL